jgi:PAS domain S-box-containing protein
VSGPLEADAPRSPAPRRGRAWARWLGRSKEALAVSGLTLAVVATMTGLHLVQLARVVVAEATQQADLIARQVYDQAGRTLARTPGLDPGTVLRGDPELRGLVEASVGYSSHLLYILIADREGMIVVHTERERETEPAPTRPTLGGLLAMNGVERFLHVYGEGRTHELVLPLLLDNQAFGSVRVGVSTVLLSRELSAAVWQSLGLAALALPAAWGLAMAVAAVLLRPVRRLAQEVDRLRRGEFELSLVPVRRDEVGELAAQLQLLSRELQSDRVRTLSERAQLQHVVEILEDGAVFFTPDSRILFFNRAAAALLGQPAGAAVGRRLADVLAEAHPLRRLLDPAFAERRDLRGATATVTVDGRPRELLVSAFFVSDARAVTGAVVLLRDLESLRTLQSLISYSAKLAALGRLTSGVAHEVKNPLNAMMIHLELLKEQIERAPATARHSLDVIAAEIRRLDRVVQDFLSFIRPRELDLKPVDVGAVLTAVATLLEAEWKAAGVRFVLSLDPAGPTVMADEELLRQAFLNIVLNACQAMPRGGAVTLGTAARPDGLTVTVRDEGVGIPPDALEQVFKLYFTTKPAGSGIGLSLVFRIVQMHDGTVSVASEPGRGTVVTVELPAR